MFEAIIIIHDPRFFFCFFLWLALGLRLGLVRVFWHESAVDAVSTLQTDCASNPVEVEIPSQICVAELNFFRFF